MDEYEIEKAVRPIADFIDDISTWYLRRSRDRFKKRDTNIRMHTNDTNNTNDNDMEQALLTTQYVLITLAKVLAPFIPFISESIYKDMNGEKESVHLEEWPSRGQNIFSKIFKSKIPKILEEMKEVRRIVSLGLEERAREGIKVRQPLQKLKIKNEKLKGRNDLLQLIKDEVNVKEVTFVNDRRDDVGGPTSHKEVELDTELTTELKEEGQYREILRYMQDLRKKEGLTPGDIVGLVVETNAKGKLLFEKFDKQIKQTALFNSVEFKSVENVSDINVDDLSFKFKIIK